MTLPLPIPQEELDRNEHRQEIECITKPLPTKLFIGALARIGGYRNGKDQSRSVNPAKLMESILASDFGKGADYIAAIRAAHDYYYALPKDNQLRRQYGDHVKEGFVQEMIRKNTMSRL